MLYKNISMIYPLIGIAGGLGFFIYSDHNSDSNKETPQLPSSSAKTATTNSHITDSFSQSTIQHYTHLKTQKQKYTLYSKLHQQPIATHRIITSNDSLTDISKTAKREEKEAKEMEKQEQKEEVNCNRNQTLYSNVFQTYAQQLISTKKCNSVQLLEGPIFPKDSPFKQKSQKIDQVFNSSIKISPQGRYITDKYFAIVICNKESRHFLNGFTMRRGYGSDSFNLTRYLTSLIKIEEQTGLKFNISGEPLITIDYDNINKERKYSDY